MVPSFFKQQVNQWLCIALIGLMCFWTVLFYLTHKAEAIGSSLVAESYSSVGANN